VPREAPAKVGNQPWLHFEGDDRVARREQTFRELPRAGANFDDDTAFRHMDSPHDIEDDAAIAQEMLAERFAGTGFGA
jgi:hypothetical protein